MNRNKKEQERLRKRQSRLKQNQKLSAEEPIETTQQVPSCSSLTITQQQPSSTVMLQENPQIPSPTKLAWHPQRLPQSTQQTQCQLGLQRQCPVADTTCQLIRMVGDDNTEITDDVIQAMLNLMKALSMDNSINVGFLTPAEIRLYSSDPTSYLRKIPMTRDCLLIHPLTGHWVTSVYRKNSNTVTVYDSMQTENHYYEIRNQVQVLYGSDIACRLQYVPVQQQDHMRICGGMALAFATSVFHGTDPQAFNYDMPKVRGHIQACLSNGTIQQFPALQTFASKSVCTARQKGWTPLLTNYFNKQHKYEQIHGKTTGSAQTNQNFERNNPVNSSSFTSTVGDYRYRRTDNKKNADKVKNTQTKQHHCNLTESEKHDVHTNDKQRKNLKRANRIEIEEKKLKDKDNLCNQQKRSRMSSDERNISHEKDRMTESEKHDVHTNDKQRKNLKRVNRTEIEEKKMKDKDNLCNQQKRSRMSSEERNISREKDRNRKKCVLFRMSSDEKDTFHEKDRSRKNTERSRMTSDERNISHVIDRNMKKTERSRMSSDERNISHVIDRNRKKCVLFRMSSEEKNIFHEKDRNRKKGERSQMRSDERNTSHVIDRNRKKCERSQMSSDERNISHIIDRNRKKCVLFRMSSEEKNIFHEKDRNRKKGERSRISSDEKHISNIKDRNRKKVQRSRISSDEKHMSNIKDRNRKKAQRSQISSDEKHISNIKHRNRKTAERSRMCSDEKHMSNIKDRNRKKTERSRISSDEKHISNIKDRNRKKGERSRISSDEKHISNIKDRNRKKGERSRISSDEKHISNIKDRNRKKIERSRISSDEKHISHIKDRNRKKDERSRMQADEKDISNEKDRNRKKDVRSQMTSDERNITHVIDRNRKNGERFALSESDVSKHRLKDKERKAKTRAVFIPSQDLISNFHNLIKEGPTYICTCCFRLLYKRTVIQVNKNNYKRVATGTLNHCLSGRQSHGREYICYTCHKKLMAGKMPPQAQANSISPEKIPDVLNRLCPLEVQLITKVIPFMKIVSLPRGAQHGLKGQVVLVPADLSKISTSLPRPSSESQIIALALKRRLTDKNSVHKQYIRPNYVTCALNYLKENNEFYKDITFRTDWQLVSEQNNPDLWSAVAVENEDTEVTQNELDNLYDNECSDHSSFATSLPQTTEQTSEKCQIDKDSENLIDSEDEIEQETPSEFLTDLQFQRSVNSDTCIQPVNGVEVKTSDVLNLAPAEGQTPLSISKEPYWEAMAFPTLLPTGVNTYHQKDPRPTKLSAKQYVNCRLLSCDTRFAESPEYTFAALDWLERETIKQSISISTRKCFQEDISVKQFKDPQNVSKLLKENQIFAAFKSIRGSPQYFKNMHLDMLAKLRQLGPYTFFITGSAAEFHWPEVIQVVARQYGETLTDDDIANMNWETKRSWLQRNPVTVARQIDFVFEQLWAKVLLSGTHPIGQILNYDLRKEMQGRGTAHFHAAVHILGAPVLDKDSDQSFTEFADRHISCCLPDKDEDPELFELVQSRQTHHHTRTCKRRKGTTCRFSFPKPPSDTSVIARVPNTTTLQNETSMNPSKEVAAVILGKMYQYLTTTYDKSNPCTLDDILSAIGVSSQDYEAALKISQRRTRLIMKRSPQDLYVNNYNPTILKCLRSNMDIQMITSIWACIAYITSYICKPEKNMSELMRKASKESADKNIRERMYDIGNQLRKGREVSHHEAIMRVLSIPLRRSNIPVQFISTDYKENRTRMLKSSSVLESLKDDDRNIYVPGIHEKYAARPSSLEDLCLADFAANYVTASFTKNENSEDLDECDADQTVGVIKLQNSLGRMKKRQNPQVIRYHFISKQNDPEQYHHRLLLLYKPWRDETELKIDSYTDSFKNVQSELVTTIKKYEPFYEEVDSVLENFDPDELLPEAWEQVAAQTEQEKLENTTRVADPSYAFLDPTNITSDTVTAPKPSDRTFSLTSTVKYDDAYYYQMVTSLNQKQRLLFDSTYKWAVDTRLSDHPPSPFYIFLSGGGGVGKTHLINTIYQGLIRALRTPGQNPDLPTVLLTASTGKAAANISGTTLHSAFALPVRDSASKNQYRKPSPEKLNSLRASYTNLQVIIADEISMFGAQSLNNLSLCLQDIFQDYNHPFAHKSILAVGDLLQLNPVGDSPVFKTPKGGYEALAGSLWNQYFKLYELTDIVRQQGDPQFAEILSRLRLGCHTAEDIDILKQLDSTPAETFQQKPIHIVLTNEQANMYNEQILKQFPDTVTLTASDSKRDKSTNTIAVSIQNTSLYQTGNLPKQITLAEKCAVMITKNIDIADHLVNGTIGIVEKIHINRENCLSSTVFVKFPMECIGEAAKRRSPPHLKHCVPIEAITSSFFLAQECPVPVERKMFPLILAFAITSHKSQGSTYEYCIADLTKSSKMKTLAPGQAYTILSRVTSRKGLMLKNFSADSIVVNKAAVAEMDRMRSNSFFTWNHPLNDIAENNFIIAFLNIRTLKSHHKDLKSEKFLNKVSILCVCETHVKDITPFTIDGFYLYGKATEHGLAIYVKNGLLSSNIKSANQIQIMARTFFLKCGRLHLFLTYKQPNQGSTIFLQNLIQEVQNINYSMSKIVIGGDFNINDDHFLSSHGFQQHIHQPTHIQGGMIDHIYSNFESQSGVFPLPYTDHFLTWIVLPQ